MEHSWSYRGFRSACGKAVRHLCRRAQSRLINAGLMAVPVPSLTSVSIETNSACNRKCQYCPNARHVRPPGKLSDDLFFKIVKDLKNMDFCGDLGFSFFNEPLLDKRLPELMDYAKKSIPRLRLYLNTNGDYLTLELWMQMRKAGLEYANITLYDADASGKVKEILKSLPEKERDAINAHTLDLEALCNRAGSVTLPEAKELPLNRYCSRPFYQLCLDYQGKAVLCCNDYFGDVEIGDIRRSSVDEIWKRKVFAHYRKKLLGDCRTGLKVCDTCTYV